MMSKHRLVRAAASRGTGILFERVIASKDRSTKQRAIATRALSST
jgi:hypothetical protein